MIGVGVIGYGYWGPNLVRNFLDHPGVRVIGVCDVSQNRLDQCARRHPGIKTVQQPAELLSDPRIDAIVIATPVATHFPLAAAAIEAGKHVLVEKPLTASSDEAERLIELANLHGCVLMVDHTFLYTPAVRTMKNLVDSGELGEVLYFDSVRVNLGLFRHDVNVLWDLAVHDLSIMGHLLPATPTAVSATAMSHVPGEPENLAYLTFFYPGRLLAHIHVNWLAPVKLRSTVLGGSRKMLVYDDLESDEKLKVYDKGVTLTDDPDLIQRLRISYRAGDMKAPRLETTEALQLEVAHFVECIEQGRRPLSDGEAGLRVVRWLEAAGQSLAAQGRPVELSTLEVTA